jgi:hypothetical protein
MGKKGKCAKCGNFYNRRSLHVYKPTGELRCRRCLIKYGENKFYASKQELSNQGKNFVGKYSLSPSEKKAMWRRLVLQGMTPQEASRKLNYLLVCLKNSKRRARVNEKQAREKGFSLN